MHKDSRKKNSFHKCTGDPVEDFQEYFENFETIANRYVLDNKRILKYLHKLFNEDAKGYYRSNVQDMDSGYIEGINVMREKYSTTHRNMRTRIEPLSLQFTKKSGSKYCHPN